MNSDNRIQDLVDQLQTLRELHDQLLQTVRGKQRAMRAGEMETLDSWTARERFLIERINATDKDRQKLTERLAEDMGLDQTPTVTFLANHLDEPGRSKLLALAGAVRTTAEQIFQINQVNDEVTREILNCFAQMQRQIAAVHCDLGLYDPNGQKKMGTAMNILDAVG